MFEYNSFTGSYNSENETIPFELTMNHSVFGTHENRYFGFSNNKEVEEIASKTKVYIMYNSKASFAKLIKYPIKVNINNEKLDTP